MLEEIENAIMNVIGSFGDVQNMFVEKNEHQISYGMTRTLMDTWKKEADRCGKPLASKLVGYFTTLLIQVLDSVKKEKADGMLHHQKEITKALYNYIGIVRHDKRVRDDTNVLAAVERAIVVLLDSMPIDPRIVYVRQSDKEGGSYCKNDTKYFLDALLDIRMHERQTLIDPPSADLFGLCEAALVRMLAEQLLEGNSSHVHYRRFQIHYMNEWIEALRTEQKSHRYPLRSDIRKNIKK